MESSASVIPVFADMPLDLQNVIRSAVTDAQDPSNSSSVVRVLGIVDLLPRNVEGGREMLRDVLYPRSGAPCLDVRHRDN